MARERHQATEPPPGVRDVSPPGQPGTHATAAVSPSGFWRIRIYLAASPEPGAPDHVVQARDAVEAEARCYTELGIRSVDKNVNIVDIMPASEAEFLVAQIRRLPHPANDLRGYAKLKDDEGKDLDEEDPDYGRMTLPPLAGVTIKGQYKLTKKGEVIGA